MKSKSVQLLDRILSQLEQKGMESENNKRIRKYCLEVIDRRKGNLTEDTLLEIIVAFQTGRNDVWNDVCERLPQAKILGENLAQEKKARQEGNISELLKVWKERETI